MSAMDGAIEPYRDVFTGVFWEPLPHTCHLRTMQATSRLAPSLNNPNHRIMAAFRNGEAAVEVGRVVDGY